MLRILLVCVTGVFLGTAWAEEKMLPADPPAGLGLYYEATVPDTLDLAERAGLGVHHFVSTISAANDYEMYWVGYAGKMFPQWSPLMACQPKCMEAMAMERLMSGSREGLEIEGKMVNMLASHIGEEGIYWVPKSPEKPWLARPDLAPYANVHGQGRMIRAMTIWYQYTKDSKWKDLCDRMVDGMDRSLVVHKDDYAYFPTQGWMEEEYYRSCFVKGKGWKDTSEPDNEKGGEEGSLFNHQGHIAGALANWYMLTGNRQALKLSGELVRFLTKPKFWADWKGGEYPGVVGKEHAHWQGHFHGHINTLRAILEYAVAANDVGLKQFVRDGYEWARQQEWVKIGCVISDPQGCGCGRLIGLAVKLTDAGVGDYWEDVDLYIRNQGVEMQFTDDDLAHLRTEQEKDAYLRYSDIGKDSNAPQGEAALNAMLGGFSFGPSKIGWAGCCSPHGNMGLFYAWDGALRCSDGVARVNLLLNRASPWMDIDSYLPYEGKVVLRNKTAREAFVRMPLYADLATVRCEVNGHEVSPGLVGRYLRFERLVAGDAVTIKFPATAWTEKWTLSVQSSNGFPGWPAGTVFSVQFKANTVVDLSPLPAEGVRITDYGTVFHPYQNRKQQFAGDKARLKKVTRFVTPVVLKW
jgi:hypothetical protein